MAVRWLRGEFATRTDARAALGVRTIVDDAGFYDQLKIMSRFVTFAGYRGLLVCLDEMVNLYKIVNTQSMMNTDRGMLYPKPPKYRATTNKRELSVTALRSPMRSRKPTWCQ